MPVLGIRCKIETISPFCVSFLNMLLLRTWCKIKTMSPFLILSDLVPKPPRKMAKRQCKEWYFLSPSTVFRVHDETSQHLNVPTVIHHFFYRSTKRHGVRFLSHLDQPVHCFRLVRAISFHLPQKLEACQSRVRVTCNAGFKSTNLLLLLRPLLSVFWCLLILVS